MRTGASLRVFGRPPGRCILGLLLLLCSAEPASGDEPYPYELDTGRELALSGTGLLVLGGAGLVDRSRTGFTEEDLAALDRSGVWGPDRGTTHRWSPTAAVVSDGLLYTMAVAPFGLLLTDAGKREPWTLTTMYLETQLLNLGTTALLKNVISRPRPFAYNEDARIPREAKLSLDARRSFPSGHSSTTFAAATFLGVVNERLNPGSSANPWVWGASYAAATTTAVLRVMAGKHYPTDVLAGAGIGILFGWLVPKLHELDPDPQSGDPMGGAPIVVVAFSF